MGNDNDSGISPMRMACIQLHEMYLELQRSGFTRREALYLVAKVFTNGATTEED